MARGKRGPPISHYQKWKQIKNAGWNVKIPYPNSPRNKGIVTRYHRQIFGGKFRHFDAATGRYKMVHTPGLKAGWQSATRNKEVAKEVFGKRKGFPRLGAIVPRNSQIVKSTKNYIVLKRKHTLEYIYKSIADVQRSRRPGEFRVRVGNQLMAPTYNKAAAIAEYHRLREKYEKTHPELVDQIYIEHIEFTNQATIGDYLDAKRKNTNL